MDKIIAFSDDANFSRHSGYSILSKYIQDSTCIHVERLGVGLTNRLANRLFRTKSVSSWYQVSSANLEWQVLQASKKKSNILIHLLWGERDFGYLDQLLNLDQHRLCVTFHACSDELNKIITQKDRLRKLHGIILMSESQRHFFEEQGVEPQNISVIYHGIDTEYFTPLQQRNKQSSTFNVLSVGNYRRKFPLLRTICLSLQEHSHIHFQILCSSQHHHLFGDLNNVTLLQRLSSEELRKTYQNASCQLLCMEDATANNALLEGLSCGVPLVAEDVGGIFEYTGDDCAYLATENNAQELIEMLLVLSKSMDRQIRMSNAARQKALTLSWDKVAQNTKNFYHKIAI
ncbi:glycosyl transferase group 1 [[Leptolyngbya] sp. PCC 7376]|uniref:glycosyltransferase family 4 protein n=1 Tax=[Leptolyngbya] sp. PCC 7376 TaxID=111781 RepID=UPI00029ECE22|nr:glycosyltransferase family 4 protein [[Leptolyngbya] sp. PCC 7376]AFY37239.1 glycosyl transferase group 1 [[Leptolyngbya] sp. PCC 7376]